MYGQDLFSFILVIMCFVLIFKNLYHLLMLLMCIEFLVLMVLYSVFSNLVFMELEVFYLVFMVFFVVEGVLGLSLLVNMMHFKGNDYLKNLSLMLW